ncbi:hypothetical protein RIR_jg13538.t1 [Rhizophagus irregularis DAOM 181602=DAOM 197198]|uniref:Uncharacterized protein n=1 Tax=Rhizophagus irregularis (strain DAOM 197198w) TaxID=1432141 RepID=A0A015KKK2_RHIIW|nr:hypothetical protein RirG_108210 [Rhizophagus irregularis DAOM 197198w]GBC22735.1 hypothetical protein RIR_jg13538.t1 [Rhizophagus irregularis DAOM 181602=DAOM 197198]
MPDGPMTLLKHLGTRYRPLWGYNSAGRSTNHLWWSTNLREPWIHCSRLIPSVVYMGGGSLGTLYRNELPLHKVGTGMRADLGGPRYAWVPKSLWVRRPLRAPPERLGLTLA